MWGQVSKAQLIYGELNESEFSILTEHLNPNGLAIFYWRPKDSKLNSSG